MNTSGHQHRWRCARRAAGWHWVPNRQRGAVLIISLLILLMLTVIGLAGMQTTTLEEKMSGNMRDRNLAFQAAETALSAAEAAVAAAVQAKTFKTDCTAGTRSSDPGLYEPRDSNCDGTKDSTQVWDSIAWDNSSSYGVGGHFANLSANPRYIVELLPCVMAGGPPPACTEYRYRITARAAGGTPDAVVILQSIYTIGIPP